MLISLAFPFPFKLESIAGSGEARGRDDGGGGVVPEASKRTRLLLSKGDIGRVCLKMNGGGEDLNLVLPGLVELPSLPAGLAFGGLGSRHTVFIGPLTPFVDCFRALLAGVDFDGGRAVVFLATAGSFVRGARFCFTAGVGLRSGGKSSTGTALTTAISCSFAGVSTGGTPLKELGSVRGGGNGDGL